MTGHVDPFASQTVSPEDEGMQAVDVPAAVPQHRSSEAISVTLKAHGGHDAPWLVFKGSAAAEVKEMLQDAVQAELMDDVVAAAKTFAALGAPSRTAAAKPAAPAAPVANAKTCAHGTRVRRTGTGKNGPWVAHFCPLPQERKAEQCPAVWGD